MKDRIVIGTRGSRLALAQTEQIVEALRKFAAQLRYELVTIRTRGDEMDDVGRSAVEGKRLFTREIEESLIRGEIDIAVHSMKDLTAELSRGLVIAAVPPRADPRDALISRSNATFQQLPKGARVGTSSPRRRAQLLAARRDLEIVDMHGNVDTRLRKLVRGDYDAIVLAAAGLLRLGLEGHATEFLPTDVILPAVGQGALAIQCREDDDAVRDLVSHVDDKQTRRAIDAERSFARRLGASCRLPIAAYAKIESANLTIDGMVADPSGHTVIRDRMVSDYADPERTGEELAEALLSQGAASLLEGT